PGERGRVVALVRAGHSAPPPRFGGGHVDHEPRKVVVEHPGQQAALQVAFDHSVQHPVHLLQTPRFRPAGQRRDPQREDDGDGDGNAEELARRVPRGRKTEQLPVRRQPPDSELDAQHVRERKRQHQEVRRERQRDAPEVRKPHRGAEHNLVELEQLHQHEQLQDGQHSHSERQGHLAQQHAVQKPHRAGLQAVAEAHPGWSVSSIARGIRAAVDGSRAAGLAGRLAKAALLVWAAGTGLAEPLAQAGAYALLLVAALRARRLELARDVRRFCAVAAALAAWQAISPVLAAWSGSAADWPKSGRYGQFFDTLAPALAASAAGDAPWVARAWVVSVGWTLSTALGAFQHFVRWPFDQPAWFRTPVDRVRESFSLSGPARYGAGGFLFHRLRFAHGAVAALGPALAVALRTRSARVALAGIATTAALLAATYFSYARAALLVGLAVVALAVALLGRGWTRWGGVAAAAAVALGVFASPEWRSRLLRGEQNLLGGDERRLSMEVGWELVRAHPLLGVGFGRYQEAAWATRGATAVTPLLSIDAHNLWLTAWAETGFAGLLLTAAYHVLLAQALLRRFREGSWIAAGALLSFAGFHL